MNVFEMKAGLLAKKQARKIVYSASGKVYLMFVVPSDPKQFVNKSDHIFPRNSVLILVAAPNGSSLSMNEGGALEIFKEGVQMVETMEPFSESYKQIEELYENFLQIQKEQEEAVKKIEEERKTKASGIILPPDMDKKIIL